MKLNYSPELIHIYGPFGIQSYGLFIVLAIAITVWAIRRDKRFRQLNLEPVYLNIITVAVLAGCIGGRLVEVITEYQKYAHWYDWFALWQGGFSVLGSILGVIIITPLYLKKIKVPILPTCDLVAIYAPLLQSIARLGCFTAGCCYGTTTKSIFGVIYTNRHTLAPYGITIHPTQLYSSISLFLIFLFMYFIGQRIFKKTGQLFAAYLMFAALERFFVDFWRAERIMINELLSLHQIIALALLIAVGVLSYAVTTINTCKTN
jgi:phosphatidylglycerol---prolipoprotein diacylglyceryl transferase